MTKVKKKDESGSSYEKKIQERIGQAMFNEEDFDEHLTVAQLEAWAEEARRKKTGHHRRWLSVAVCAMFICVFSLMAKYFIYADPIVEAGKGEKPVTTEVKRGAVIKNNEEDAQDNMGVRSETHTTWEDVLTASKKYPDMVVPGEMPEGYTFEKLEIMVSSTASMYKFSFSNKAQEGLCINEVSAETEAIIPDYDGKKTGKSGRNIYFFYDDDSVTATVRIDGLNISSTGSASEEEMISVIDNLKSGR